MTEGGQTSFTVLINEEKLSQLFVPDRISKLFRRIRKHVRVYRGNNTRIYHVKWSKIRDQSGIEIYFMEGWSDFVKDSGIEVGDILDLYYMGDGAFKVSIWRGDKYVPDYIEISSDSSNTKEKIENGAETDVASHNDAEIEGASHKDAELDEDSHNYADSEEDAIFLPDCRRDWIPDFEVRYTGPYSAVGRLFARLHFSFFGYENPAEIWDGNNKKCKAKLFVKRDPNRKIVLCNIREGVKEMMRGVRVMPGKKLVVQLLRKNPLAFKVSIM